MLQIPYRFRYAINFWTIKPVYKDPSWDTLLTVGRHWQPTFNIKWSLNDCRSQGATQVICDTLEREFNKVSRELVFAYFVLNALTWNQTVQRCLTARLVFKMYFLTKHFQVKQWFLKIKRHKAERGKKSSKKVSHIIWVALNWSLT